MGQTYPTPWKGHGTRDQEGTWHERYPTPCGQINTCENITFPQISWRAVISNSATDLVWTWLPPGNTGNKVSCRIKSWLGASLYFPRYNVRRQIRFIWQENATNSFSNSTWIRLMLRQGESRVDSHWTIAKAKVKCFVFDVCGQCEHYIKFPEKLCLNDCNLKKSLLVEHTKQHRKQKLLLFSSWVTTNCQNLNLLLLGDS